MSVLKPGTLCVIAGGIPTNIGVIVEIVRRLRLYGQRDGAYVIKTVSGRPIPQLRVEGELVSNWSPTGIIARHMLRPLTDSGQGLETDDARSEPGPVSKPVAACALSH